MSIKNVTSKIRAEIITNYQNHPQSILAIHLSYADRGIEINEYAIRRVLESAGIDLVKQHGKKDKTSGKKKGNPTRVRKKVCEQSLAKRMSMAMRDKTKPRKMHFDEVRIKIIG